MRTSRFLWLVFAAASTLLAACESGGKSGRTMEVLDSRPDGITIRDTIDNRPFAGVTADEHCATYGKAARLLEQKNIRGYEAAEHPGSAVFIFQCYDPHAAQ